MNEHTDAEQLAVRLRAKAQDWPSVDVSTGALLEEAADALLSAQGEQPRGEAPAVPLVSEIEEFRREHHIHDDGKLEPWAIQENRVLEYLCYLGRAHAEGLKGKP